MNEIIYVILEICNCFSFAFFVLFLIILMVYIIKFVKVKLIKSSILYKIPRDKNNFSKIYKDIYRVYKEKTIDSRKKRNRLIILSLIFSIIIFILLLCLKNNETILNAIQDSIFYPILNSNIILVIITTSTGIGCLTLFVCLFASNANYEVDIDSVNNNVLEKTVNLQKDNKEIYLIAKDNKKVFISLYEKLIKSFGNYWHFNYERAEIKLNNNISKEKEQQLLDEIEVEVKSFLKCYSLLKPNSKKFHVAYSNEVNICKISKNNTLIIDCYLYEYVEKITNRASTMFKMNYDIENLYVKVKICEMFKYIVEEIVSKYDG